jgi:hypothetical protein
MAPIHRAANAGEATISAFSRSIFGSFRVSVASKAPIQRRVPAGQDASLRGGADEDVGVEDQPHPRQS